MSTASPLSTLPFLGPSLRRHRLAKGFTQSSLAERLGSYQHYIHYLEHGHRTPSFAMFERICQTLGVAMSDVLLLAENMARESAFGEVDPTDEV
ncbi:MAG: helix-turn-helix domain-containing protein [Armatimonadota bacterium]